MALTFLHPNIQTTVVDNSAVNVTATGGGTALFQPYISDKGADNVIEQITILSDFLNDHGLPNYKKHGQSIYNVINWLNNGGQVYGYRMMPSNAQYANVVLSVKTKSIAVPVLNASGQPTYAADGVTPITKQILSVKTASDTIANLTNKTLLVEQLASLPLVDSDGWKTYPLCIICMKGRGVYGNKYSFALSLETKYDSTYDFRTYELTLMEIQKDGSLVLSEGPYPVSFFPEAISLAGTSMFIQQVVADYCPEIDVTFSDTNYESLTDDLLAAMGTEADTPQNIDFLFCMSSTTDKSYDSINIDTGTISLDYYQGVPFVGGYDGYFDTKFDFSTVTDATLPTSNASAIEKELVAIYSGVKFPAILNKQLYPFNIVLDANYSGASKEALAAFTDSRRDCFGCLDTNVQASAAAALIWRTNVFQEADICNGIFSQSMIVYDSYTSTDILMTATYFLAGKIPYTDAQYGVQYPFVGPNRGLIAGFKSLDWNPTEYEKEDLYDARINYIEQNYQNTKFNCQLTTQAKTSALSNINNVRVLMQMIRDVEKLAANYEFEFGSQQTLNSFNSALSNILSPWISNGACSVASGAISQTAYQAQTKTAQVSINVVFNNVIERILIEFNVGS
jgi:hypothetical protein